MIIDFEFKSLLPPLGEEDYKGLEESLKREGCRDPLVIWGEILVDGHNRYEICTRYTIPYQTVQRDFKDRNEVILWIISNQLSRRNLTPFQRSELALRLKPKLEAEARERQATSTGGANPQLRQKSVQAENGKVKDKLGEIAGVSRETIRNTETILTQGTPEDITEVREGKASISGKAKEIKGRKEDKPVNDPLENGDERRIINNILKANLYSVWKTLNGVKEDYIGKLEKIDEKELNALLNRIQTFIDRKGGTHYEKGE